jgi:very-short-patch-repair endonuclease
VEGAALSHHSAAAFYKLDVRELETVHVIVPRHGVRGPKGVCVHCVKTLPSPSIVRAGPFRVTRIERTLLDLAAFLDDESLQTVFDSAWLKKKVDPTQLASQLGRARAWRRGIPRLRRAVADAVARGRPLESRLEVMFWRAAKANGLRPEVQVPFLDSHRPRYRLDFLFRAENLVVETMGFSVHGTEEKFERDAIRMARIVASGRAVLPVTYRMMKDTPEDVIRWVDEALAVRRQRRSMGNELVGTAAPGQQPPRVRDRVLGPRLPFAANSGVAAELSSEREIRGASLPQIITVGTSTAEFASAQASLGRRYGSPR